MTNRIIFEDWNQLDYGKAWKKQEKIFNRQIDRKQKNEPTENTLIFVEHPHVYTLGKNGDRSNMLITDEMLEKINATYYHIDRGGDVTYHGPGQIVGYPIFDLEKLGISYKGFIENIENGIIKYLRATHGIETFQLPKATGVWLETERGHEKICAIGTRASKYVTMHGFALNINTNLEYFDYINPCGFTDKGVTSLEKIKGVKQDFEKEKSILKGFLAEAFEAELV
ncbi:Octanoyltransferase [Salinivirga cyanobacteriivorans]|uniref:Octanoyltransferase n=1 Tax=Salinivirga cyanobacteriivorans TaxID=1307839 RepID=A0A0S2I1H6_9BACT|nr:lipoyl(octanoyl) transferase LipB [Salinivirga cyanobacteriivorans]ALO16150.1 Octanoyltransferase [Salinivirga cyanobacteriivorans]